MKHRNIMGIILLSIFTFGIYDIYWLVKVKKELNARTNVHTPSIWLLFAPLLLFVVLMIAAFAITASRAGDPYSTSSSGASTGANVLLILIEMVAILAFIPITFYWFFKFSKAVSQYTHGELSTAINFILLWFLRFVGIAIIQDKFNDMLVAGDGGGSAAASYGPVGPAPMVPQQPADPVATLPAPQNTDGEGTQPTPPANPIG